MTLRSTRRSAPALASISGSTDHLNLLDAEAKNVTYALPPHQPLAVQSMSSSPENIVHEVMRAAPDPVHEHGSRDSLALHIACANCESVDEVIAELAAEPASLHLKDSDGNLPLHWACFNKSLAAAQIVRMVVDAAPEAANEAGQYGRLPLHTACANSGSVEAVCIVLAVNEGALRVRGVNGGLPLHWACFNQTDAAAQIVSVVMAAAPEAVQERGEYGLPLHIVCAHSSSIQAVHAVLEADKGALHIRGINGDLPLHWACCNQTEVAVEVVQAVLNAAPDTVREVGQDGRLPLHIVCAHSSSLAAVQRILHSHPAALQVRESNQNLPLHCACWNKTESAAEIVKLILDGAPEALQQPGEDLRLPLHVACADSASPDTVKVLLEAYPAALRIMDQGSNLPLHWACYNQTGAADVIARVLIEAAPDTVQAVSERGRLPLHCACCNETEAAAGIIKVVIALAPDTLRVSCQYGRLPLHAACAHSASLEAVSAVTNAYTDALRVKDIGGGLPLHRIGMNKGAIAADIARLVMTAAPAGLHVRDTDGNLPLDVARKNDNRAVYDVFHQAMEVERAKAEAELFALCAEAPSKTKKKKKIRKNQSAPALSLLLEQEASQNGAAPTVGLGGHRRCGSGTMDGTGSMCNTSPLLQPSSRRSPPSPVPEESLAPSAMRLDREVSPPATRTPKPIKSWHTTIKRPEDAKRKSKATVVKCEEKWQQTRLLANEAVVAAIESVGVLSVAECIQELATVCEMHAVMADKQLVEQARSLRKTLKEKQRKMRRKTEKVEKSVQLLQAALCDKGDDRLAEAIQEAERLVGSDAAADSDLESLLAAATEQLINQRAAKKEAVIVKAELEFAAEAALRESSAKSAAAPEAEVAQSKAADHDLLDEDALCVVCVDNPKEMLLFPCE